MISSFNISSIEGVSQNQIQKFKQLNPQEIQTDEELDTPGFSSEHKEMKKRKYKSSSKQKKLKNFADCSGMVVLENSPEIHS